MQMKREIYFNYICTVVLITLSEPLTAQYLNVPDVPQEKDYWCWDACSISILEYYGTIGLSQCSLAEYTRSQNPSVYGTVNCCIDPTTGYPSVGCNNPNWLYSWYYNGTVADVLDHFGSINTNGTANPLSISEIQTEIQFQRPFIVNWQWTGTSGGHDLVGNGISGNYIYLMDPWRGISTGIWDYNWVLNGSGSEGSHTWSSTLKMLTSPFYSCLDNFESNDDGGHATQVFLLPLTGAANSNEDANIGFYSDQDWYRIDLNVSGTLQLNLTNLPFNYNIYLYSDAYGLSTIDFGTQSGISNESITYYNSTSTLVHLYAKVISANPNDYWAGSCYNIQFIYTPSVSCSMTGIIPSLFSPGTSSTSGQIVSTLTPVLSWPTVPGAQNYGVYIRDLVSNTLVVNNACATSGTNYVVSSGILSNGGQYRWNIKASDGCGSNCVSDYAYPYYFQTQTGSSCSLSTQVPSLISPGIGSSSGQSISTTSPTLSWNPVPGATNYGVYVRDVSTNTLVLNSDCATNTTSYTIPTGVLYNGGQYRWNIMATLGCGNSCVSNYSIPFYFNVQTTGCALSGMIPTLISPGTGITPGQTLSTTTPTFYWNAISGATTYDVFVRDMNTNLLVVNQSCANSTTNYTVSSGILGVGGEYSWFVRANLGCTSCVSNYATPLYFQIASSCNYSLSSTSASFAINGGSDFFAISASSGCPWNVTTSDPSMISLLTTNGSGSDNIYYTVSNNPGNSRVGYIYVQGSTFIVNQSGALCQIPTTPVPLTGSANCPGRAFYSSNNITLSWTNILGVYYDIEVVEYPFNNTNIIYSQSCISGNNYTINSSNLQAGKIYAWRVRASVDCINCNSQFSQYYFFHIQPSISYVGSINFCDSVGITISTDEIITSLPSVVSYQWYKNGLPFGSNSFSNYITMPGTYSVKLIYQGSTSCVGPDTTINSQYAVISLSNSPAAPILSSNSPVCQGGDIILATIPNGGANYNWSGPNGFSSNSVSETIYSVDSIYSGYYYCYIIKNGCQSAIDSILVSVYPSTNASFGYSVNGDTISFINTSLNSTSFTWNFGDGQTSNQTNPVHVFSAAGNYIICLTSNSANCNPNSYCQQIQVGGAVSNNNSNFEKLFYLPSTPGPGQIMFGATDIVQSEIDSGYVCIGYEYIQTGPNRIQYFKVNKQGQLLWVREFPPHSYTDVPHSIIRSGSGYVISFTVMGNIYGLFKIDELGNIQWMKKYDIQLPILNSTSSGGIICSSSGSNNISVVKLDDNGSILWQEQLDFTSLGNHYLTVNSIIETTNQDFIITGDIDTIPGSGFTGRNGLIIKIGFNGNLIWAKQIGFSSEDDYFTFGMEKIDGELMFLGHSKSYGPMSGYIVRCDSSGNVINTFLMPLTGTLYNIIELANNHYLTTANSSVIEFDSSFGFVSSKAMKIDPNSTFNKRRPTFDDNFVFVGNQTDPNTNETKYAIIKFGTNTTSCLDSLINFTNQAVSNSEIDLFPTVVPLGLIATIYSGSSSASSLLDSSLCHICNLIAHIDTIGGVTFCSGSNVELIADSGMTSYLWSNGDTNQSVTVELSGNYSVSIQDNYGCFSNSAPLTVIEYPLPYVYSGIEQTICTGSSAILGNAGVSGNTYAWYPTFSLDDSTISNPTANPLSTTTYQLTVTNVFNCSDSNSVTVFVNPPPLVNAGADQTISEGVSVILGDSPTASGNGPFGYYWFPQAELDSIFVSNPTATPSNTTTYTVSVIDSNGCSASDNVSITVVPLNCSYLFSDTLFNFTSTGGSHVFTISCSSSSCQWEVNNTIPWIQVSPSSMQTGNGSVIINADSCNGSPRSGSFIVAGVSYEVYQDCTSPIPCTNPVAGFVGSQTSGNCPFTVDFIDTSVTTGATSWLWTIYNGAGSPVISTVQNPTAIPFNYLGSFLVKLVVIDSCGSDSILVPDYITVSCTTSIGNLLIPDQFQVYPNPTSNYIYIAAENIENEEYIFSLRDIVGQELTSEKVDVKDNILLKRLDVAQLTSGIYMLSIESNLSKWRIKIYKL